MKAIQMIVIGLVILFFFSTDTLAFRCGSGLVTSGDTKMQVSITCGKPTSKEKACEGQQTTAGRDKDGKIREIKKMRQQVGCLVLQLRRQ